jgi:hypothetical protein
LPGDDNAEPGVAHRAYQPPGIPASPANGQGWAEPGSSPGGRDWVFDVFTPPAIYYDARSGTYSGDVPADEDRIGDRDFGLDLIGVRREPFRLQLVGYVDGEGGAWGIFENVASMEHFLAQGGRCLQALGLTIVDFALQHSSPGTTGETPVAEPSAIAVVRDDRTGETLTLTSRDRCHAGALVATVEPSDSADGQVELHQGELVTLDDATYRIEKIQLDPPEAVVSRQSPDSPGKEIKILTPRS